jgi:hypothetical protein
VLVRQSRRNGSRPSAFRYPLFVNGSDGMAETSTIEMQDRELFAAMAMQALITREGSPADMVAKQAVEYADALIEALAAIAPNPPDLRPGFWSWFIERLSNNW